MRNWAKTVLPGAAAATSHTGNWAKEPPVAALVEPSPQPETDTQSEPSEIEKPGEYQACFSLRGVPGPVFYDGDGDAFIAPSWMMKLPVLVPASGKMIVLAWSSLQVTLYGKNLDKLIDDIQLHKAAKFRVYNPKLYPVKKPNPDGPDYQPVIDKMIFADGDGKPLSPPPSFG